MATLLVTFGPPLLEFCLCCATSLRVYRSDTEAQYRSFLYLLVAHAGSMLLLSPLLLMAGHGLEAHLAYHLYFYGYWFGFTTEAILGLVVIKASFDLAMKPLAGIKELGKIVFRWAYAVSFATTAAVMFIPHPSGMAYVTRVLTEIQRAQAVLTLSLLLFVSLALRPLGLTLRSRTFGVILGLGVVAAANLASSGWLAYATHLYSVASTLKGISGVAALLIWLTYFLAREPKRGIVVLPTTSPYLHWNQVARVLGDPPGFVAIAGVPPEIFSSAELEVMRRASVKMNGTPSSLLNHSHPA